MTGTEGNPRISLRWSDLLGDWHRADFTPRGGTVSPGVELGGVAFDLDNVRPLDGVGEYGQWMAWLRDGRCPSCLEPLAPVCDIATREEWAVCQRGASWWRLEAEPEQSIEREREAGSEAER